MEKRKGKKEIVKAEEKESKPWKRLKS
jgi:hypothetical protein